VNPDLHPIVQSLNRLVAAQQKGPWDYVSTVAVVLTLLVLIWYTYETYRLRKAAQDQTARTASLLSEAQRQNETSLNLVGAAQRQNEVSASLLKEAQRQTEATARLVREAQRQNEVSVMPIMAILVVSPGQLRPSDIAYGSDKNSLVLRNVGTGPAFNVSIDKYLAGGKELQVHHGTHMLSPGENRLLSFHLQEGSTGIKGSYNTMYDWINTGPLPDPLSIIVRCRSATSVDYSFKFTFTPKDGTLTVVFEGIESTFAA